MAIRDAQPNDLDFVLEGLERNRLIEGRSPEAAAVTPTDRREYAQCIESGRVRVVEDAGEPVAFLSFRLDFEVMYVTGRFLWIDLVYVRDDQRGGGLGRRLYDEAAHIARAHGCERVVADVFAANAGSIAFHQSVGFEPLYTIFARQV